MWGFRKPNIVSGLSTFQYLPSWCHGPSSVHIFRMMSSASRVMSRFWPDMPSTLNIAQSDGRPDAATPKFSRPSDRWSSIATRFASSAGW
jgi:hypothetical protein